MFLAFHLIFGLFFTDAVYAYEEEEEGEVELDTYSAKFSGSSGMCSLQVVDYDTGAVLDSVTLSVSGIDTSLDQSTQQKNMDWSRSTRYISGYGGVSESKTFKKDTVDKYYLGVVGTYIKKPAGYYICGFRKIDLNDSLCTPFKPGTEFTISKGVVTILTSDGSNKVTAWDEAKRLDACDVYFSMIININSAMISSNAVSQILVKRIPYSVTYNTAGHNGNATHGNASRQDYSYGTGATVPSADALGIERYVTQTYRYNNTGMGDGSETLKLPFSHWSSADNSLVGGTGNGTDGLCLSYGSNVDLYTNWGSRNVTLPSPKGHTYKVTYDSKGGSDVSDSSGTQSFGGWVKTTGGTFSAGQTVTVTTDNTFVGQWTNPTVNLKAAPSRTGYSFKGWTIGGRTYAAGETVTLGSDLTAVANWEPKSYTINYDTDGGEGRFEASQTISYDTEATIINDVPEKTDYEFLGWSEKKGDDTPTYLSGQTIKNLMEEGTLTLYAVWKEIPKPVIVVEETANKDTGDGNNQETTKITEVTVITEKVIDETKTDGTKTDEVKIDEAKINDIMKRLETVLSLGELNQNELKELVDQISVSSGMNSEYVKTLIDLINNSNLTEEEKLNLIKHLTSGYLIDVDRALLNRVISTSVLSESEKKALYEVVNQVSTVTLETQKEIVSALNSGSQAVYTTADGVTYVLTKNSDGSLSVALKSLSGVRDLVIPNQLSFAGITYPVTAIAKESFKDNKELRSVTIPSNVTTIGDSAFENCSLLSRVNTVEGLVTIGNKAFSGCRELLEFNCPTTLKSIGNSAFLGCVALKKVSFNSGLLQIGSKAFKGCKALTAITLPKSILKLGASAFANCTSLKKVTFKGGKNSSLVTMGSGVFSGCKALTKILIPSKVAVIPKNAFKGCVKLKSVTGMKKVGEIGASAFEGCVKLSSFTLESRVAKLGKQCFFGCHALKKVKIKTKTLQSVGAKAFYYCHKKLAFTYPKNKKAHYKKLLKNKK